MPILSPLASSGGRSFRPIFCLAHLENLSLFYMLCLAYKSKAEELNSESPVAEEPLGTRPWAMYTELRNGRPKLRHDEASGTNRFRDRYKAAGCDSPTRVARQHRWLPAHRRRSGHAERINLVLDIGHGVGEADVCCARRHRCSGATTNHALKAWPPSLRRCHIRKWTVKRREERGRTAAQLE